MDPLKPGDRVNCLIQDNDIVSPYNEYDEIRTFEVIASDEYGYYLYVPQYYGLKGTVKIDEYRRKRLSINKRFLGEDMISIPDNLIFSIQQQLDGMFCTHCSEFFGMAVANQADGTLLCYSCRQNRYR